MQGNGMILLTREVGKVRAEADDLIAPHVRGSGRPSDQRVFRGLQRIAPPRGAGWELDLAVGTSLSLIRAKCNPRIQLIRRRHKREEG
jgi:hypothetical protein